MNVKEYILNDITDLTLKSSIKNAIDICKRLPITHVPIVENDKLIGCLSETDFQIIEDETSTISEYSHLIDFFYADENTAMLNLIKLFTNNKEKTTGKIENQTKKRAKEITESNEKDGEQVVRNFTTVILIVLAIMLFVNILSF